MQKAERQRPPGATNEGRRFRRFGNKLLLKFAATRCKIVKAGKLCRITLYSLYNPRYSHMLLLARSTLLYEAQNPRRAMLVKDCLSHNNIVFSVLYCISLRGQDKGRVPTFGGSIPVLPCGASLFAPLNANTQEAATP